MFGVKVYNRRKLDDVLEKIAGSDDCLSIILLDIDEFKLVNDTYGHQAGDSVLVEMSKLLKENIMPTDTLGRWGGEEFLIICPNTDIDNLIILADNLRKKIEEYDFSIVNRVTASFGIASSCEKMNNVDLLLENADKALYKAKLSGRNKVCK